MTISTKELRRRVCCVMVALALLPSGAIQSQGVKSEQIRSRVQEVVALKLEAVNYLCDLTTQQKQKLEQESDSDIETLLKENEAYIKRLKEAQGDRERLVALRTSNSTLLLKLRTGPFGEETLLNRSLDTTLTANQLAKIDPVRPVFLTGGLLSIRRLGDETRLSLSFSDTPFGDTEMARLKNVSNLTDLCLSDTGITDTGLEHIQSLPSLRRLDLGHTTITDKGMESIKEMKLLRVLMLGATKITDIGMSNVKDLNQLIDLDLRATQIGDNGMAYLSGLTSLERLNLQKTQVTNVGMSSLKGMSRLMDLTLEGTDISDDGVESLVKLVELTRLNVRNTQLSDRGLKKLSALPKLTYVGLAGSRATQTGVADLKRQLPNAEIEFPPRGR